MLMNNLSILLFYNLLQMPYWGNSRQVFQAFIASGLFGIPIGIIGSGFEEIVIDEKSESHDFEVLDEQEMKNRTIQAPPSFLSTTSSSQTEAYRFVNGVGSPAAVHFETLIYFLSY